MIEKIEELNTQYLELGFKVSTASYTMISNDKIKYREEQEIILDKFSQNPA